MCPPVANNGHAVIDVPLDGTVELGEGAPASALPSKPTPTVKRASTRSKLSAMVPHPAWMEFRGRRPSLGPSPVIPRLRSTYNDASGHENSVHGGKPGELAPLAFSGKFAGGLRADIKRGDKARPELAELTRKALRYLCGYVFNVGIYDIEGDSKDASPTPTMTDKDYDTLDALLTKMVNNPEDR